MKGVQYKEIRKEIYTELTSANDRAYEESGSEGEYEVLYTKYESEIKAKYSIDSDTIINEILSEGIKNNW